MIVINSLFNQDAGKPNYPYDLFSIISSNSNFFSNVEVLDLNIEFYNYLNDFRIYDSIVRIFGYYYTKKACDSNLKMNCYRYESFPCINLFLYLLNEIEGADDEYLLFLNDECKKLGLNFKYVKNGLEKLTSFFKEFYLNNISLFLKEKEIYLYVDSVASVPCGLLFSNILKKQNNFKIIAFGNQINVPEVTKISIEYKIIDRVSNYHLLNTNYSFVLFKDVISNFYKKYPTLVPNFYGLKIFPYKFSFGCPKKCNFCSERLMWEQNNIVDFYYQKNIDKCYEEIKFIHELIDINGLTFDDCDCMLFLKDQKYKKIVDYIKNNNFMCSGSTRIDNINLENISILRSLNFTNLIIGLETFNKDDVYIYAKGNRNYLDDYIGKINLLQTNGIEPQINVIICHPFQTDDQIISSIESCIVSLRQLQEKNIHLIDLSVGEIVINYPSENYFEIMKSNDYFIQYHNIENHLNLSNEKKVVINKLPKFAICKSCKLELNKLSILNRIINEMNEINIVHPPLYLRDSVIFSKNEVEYKTLYNKIVIHNELNLIIQILSHFTNNIIVKNITDNFFEETVVVKVLIPNMEDSIDDNFFRSKGTLLKKDIL